jgi:DNA-binding beta-propeller fold protein YncE
MATEPCTGHDCPPADDLDRLVHGRTSDVEAAVLTDHVGHCTGCQKKLEAIAAGEDNRLTDVVREVGRPDPPPDSAYWKALSAVEAEVSATGVFPGPARDGWPDEELKLDFLQPSGAPDKLGRLGTFEILRVVGRGGMGVVLHGYDPCLQRDIAVKVLDPALADNATARARFCREARAAAQVTHDNLVAVHTVDEHEKSGLPYLVMQLVNGESLEQRLRRVGKLPVLDVARLGQQAAAGLAAAHEKGLIHRDIKPGNILLEAGSDRVKLTDFGLARGVEDVKLTRTGFVAGTPLYMAPEQARGEEVDSRADLFSLGSVLYEAATGKPPFDGKTPLAVLRRVADDTQPSLRQVNPEVPHWLSDVVDRLLEKEPADRFQTAQEVAEIFATELARALPLTAPEVAVNGCGGRTSAYAKPRKKICWKAVVFRTLPVLAGIAIGALVVGLWPSDNPRPTPADPGPPPQVVLAGKGGPIWGLAFSPDGQNVAVGSEDGLPQLWNWRANDRIKTFERLNGNVWSMDISPDGRYLAAACDNSEVKIYDLSKPGSRSLPHPNSVKAVVFSPDGKRLATGDRGATVRVWVWDGETQVPDEVRGHRGTVHGLAYCPHCKALASAGSDGTVKVWKLDAEGKPADSPPVVIDEQSGPLYGVAFSPDGKAVAAGGWDGIVRSWDPSGTKLQTFRGHDGDVYAVAYRPDGKVLASAGQDGTVRLWDVDTGRELQVLRGGGRPLLAVRFTKDGTHLAASGRDGNVRVWEIK